jgi:uncharacterized protein (DUF433 family)
MSYQDRISIEPAIRSGKPGIKGTRLAFAAARERKLAGSAAG